MPVIIAEIGCNHGGDINTAKEMIDVAATYCKVDVVKFQKRTIEVMSEEQLNKPYLGDNSFGKTYGEHRKFLEFSIDQHEELKRYCEMKGVEYSCSVWDLPATKCIDCLMPEYIKIPSALNTNFEIIEWLINNFEGKIHISMGMTTLEEKCDIANAASGKKDKFVFYH